MSEQTPPARRSRRTVRNQGVLTSLVTSASMVTPIPVLAAFAAWPIYETQYLWVLVSATAFVTFATVWLGVRLRWGAMTLPALVLVFALLVMPVGMPGTVTAGPAAWLSGVGEGVAAVALGWKQLLTLALPLGTYQSVLVPLMVVVCVSVASASALVLHGGKWAPVAGVAYIVPVVFGTVFGSSAVSAPLRVAGVSVVAPRELALWVAATGACVVWVSWSSGRARRLALQRGREADRAGAGEQKVKGRWVARRHLAVRGFVAAVTVLVAFAASVVVAPFVAQGVRAVPRDVLDPELVIQDRVSPLASYRVWKRDDALQAELFSVTSERGRLPERVTLAVLSEYDGVDFTVGSGGESGRFERFPSGSVLGDSARVSVEVREGYADVWVPISAPLGGPPQFTGSRSKKIADHFYVNRLTGSAVAVPTSEGMRVGDGYRVEMSTSGAASLDSRAASRVPLVDVEAHPELERWLKLQQLPRSGEGVFTAIDRLRERGYLSHSLTDGAGEGLWFRELAKKHGMRFFASPAGHSWSRLELLFSQLVDQQLAAGEGSDQAKLVAGIGDDEQFAAAAAVVARALGFESRVVVGVRLGGEGDGVPGVPACVSVCTGEHVAAWVEVSGADGVWVPVDVSPQLGVPPTVLEKGEQMPEFATQAEDTDASESDPPVGVNDQRNSDGHETKESSLAEFWPVLRGIGLVLLGVLLLALLVLFVPFVKWLRRRVRRGQLVSELSALAAWDELLDSYRDGGVRVSRLSRVLTMRELGVEGGEWIAWIVDQAVYSREGISVEMADTLWAVVDARMSERRKGLGLWGRVRAWFSFQSLRGDTWLGVVYVFRRVRQRGEGA